MQELGDILRNVDETFETIRSQLARCQPQKIRDSSTQTAQHEAFAAQTIPAETASAGISGDGRVTSLLLLSTTLADHDEGGVDHHHLRRLADAEFGAQ